MPNPITELRKEGRIDEAIQLAKDRILQGIADEWDLNGLFWCYYDKLKDNGHQNLQEAQVEEFLTAMDNLLPELPNNDVATKCLDSIRKKVLPGFEAIKKANEIAKISGREAEAFELIKPLINSADTILHEDIGWVIYRYIKANLNTLSSIDVRRLLAQYMKLYNPRPSLLHSQILQLALNFAKDHPDFIFYRFFQPWNPQNLRNEDYHITYKNGQPISPFIHRIIRQIVDGAEAATPEDIFEKLDQTKITLNTVVEIYRDSYFWKLYNQSKTNELNNLWNELNRYVERFAQYGKGESHSKILSLALRSAKESDQWRLIPFFNKWGPQNLVTSDWEKEKGKDGNEYDSLAAKLLQKIYEIIKSNQSQYVDSLPVLMPVFDEGARRLREDHWPVYRYAKMLLWSGDKVKARENLKSISSQLSPQSYYWLDLAETEDSLETKMALMIKGISMQRDEKLLGKARLQLAEILIRLSKHSYAQIELSKYSSYRQSQSKSFGNDFNTLQSRILNATPDEREYAEFCKEKITEAEEVFFEDLPWHKYVITDIWKREDGKERMSLVNERGENIIISKTRFMGLRNCKIGNVIEIRKIKSDDCRETVVMARITQDPNWSIFSHKIGYVSHLNENRTAFINLPSSVESIRINNIPDNININSFVSFRIFEKKRNDRVVKEAVDIKVVNYGDGILSFPVETVVIDSVNNQKQIYHYIGLNGIEGIIPMSSTPVTLKMGDALTISYYKKKDKLGKVRTELIKFERSEETPSSLIKNVRGTVSLNYEDYTDEIKFGFLDHEYYIPKEIAGRFKEDEEAFGKAIYQKDGKWRIFELQSNRR